MRPRPTSSRARSRLPTTWPTTRANSERRIVLVWREGGSSMHDNAGPRPAARTSTGSVPSEGVVTAPAVAMRSIDKRFAAVHANRSVDLTVRRATIHGIVGENGAGKSTLMSILYGFYQADAGSIEIE